MAYKSISEQAEDSLIESAKEIDKQIQSMTKKVDLARIPKWEAGKWYYYHKQWALKLQGAGEL